MTINVVDSIMGSGKTTAAINMINNASEDEKFLYVTPVLTEVERIIEQCPSKHFTQPQYMSRKIDSMKYLLKHGRNIATTHALFQMFDREIVELCYSQGYTLIMDEVADVVDQYKIKPKDLNILLRDLADVSDDGTIIWKAEENDYDGEKFLNEKHLCEMHCLTLYKDNVIMWMFPTEIFKAFKTSYILTYMFNAQMQKYYYDYHELKYNYMHLEGAEPQELHFVNGYRETKSKYNYHKLIHILDNQKLNKIGDTEFSLSKKWYESHTKDALMKMLKDNILNYFMHITKSKSNDTIWTSFKNYKNELKGKGYTKGFLASNSRATNDYGNRHNIAYPINKFFKPTIKSFFSTKNITVNEDAYALSEMLQFIWRSAIRNNEEITIYLPSKRMRNLLIKWINDNSIKE